jgi:hypothetical protein
MAAGTWGLLAGGGAPQVSSVWGPLSPGPVGLNSEATALEAGVVTRFNTAWSLSRDTRKRKQEKTRPKKSEGPHPGVKAKNCYHY